MAQITGITKIKVDGLLLRTKPGAKLNTGGMQRTEETGDRLYGYHEKFMAASLDVTVVHTSDTKISDMNKWVGKTVVIECDSGRRYMMANAFTAETCELTDDGGGVTLKMKGDPTEEK